MISQDTIEKIRNAVDIVEIIREHVPELKRAGRNFKACCPFHEERTPSFMISPEKGIFHCFGCGVGGDAYRFLMKIEGLTFAESIKKLGKQSGIPVEDSWDNKENPQVQKRQKIFSFLEQAASFYQRCFEKLSTAGVVRTYVKKRGITYESSKTFMLGFAPSSGCALRDAALKKGNTSEDLINSGLVVSYKGKGYLRDSFRGRLMFPIHDAQGRVVAFGGRVLDATLPKYINSPESPVFSKSRILYGLFQGIKAVRTAKKIILLEGYTDVILAHQYGINNAVAPLGTALTRDHALLLKRYAEEVVLVFDPDKAGKSAAVRAAHILSGSNFFVKIAVLPDHLDPADFLVKQGSEAFKKIIDAAQDWIEFYIDQEVLKIKHKPLRPDDKTRIAEIILPYILRIENAVYRREMMRLLSGRIDIPEEALLEELKRIGQKTYKKRAHNNASVMPMINRAMRMQEDLICLLVAHPKLWSDVRLTDTDFSDKEYAEIFSALRKEFYSAGAIDPVRVMAGLSEKQSAWLSGILMEKREYAKPERIFRELHEELKKIKLKHERLQLEKEICGMAEGQKNIDRKKIVEYQKLIRSLKGGEQHGED